MSILHEGKKDGGGVIMQRINNLEKPALLPVSDVDEIMKSFSDENRAELFRHVFKSANDGLFG